MCRVPGRGGWFTARAVCPLLFFVSTPTRPAQPEHPICSLTNAAFNPPPPHTPQARGLSRALSRPENAPPAFIRPQANFTAARELPTSGLCSFPTPVLPKKWAKRCQAPANTKTQKLSLFLRRRHAELCPTAAGGPRHEVGAGVASSEDGDGWGRRGEAAVQRAVERGPARLAASIQRCVREERPVLLWCGRHGSNDHPCGRPMLTYDRDISDVTLPETAI